MRYLHQDVELFKEAINIAAYGNSMLSQTAELDYYLSEAAKELVKNCSCLVLKGAAALSKCYRVIGMATGKLEFAAMRTITADERSAVIEAVKHTAAALGCDIKAEDFENDIKAFINGNIERLCCRFIYDSVCSVFSGKESFELIIECCNASPDEGVSLLPMECAVLDVVRLEAPEYTEEYGAQKTELKARDMEIILAEKMFDICDNYLKGNIRKNSADIYDIYMLLPLVSTDDNFTEAVKKVRTERENSVLHPSSQPDNDIEELLYRIVKDEVYKQDYNELTSRLIDTAVSYDDAASAIYTAADSGVFSAV